MAELKNVSSTWAEGRYFDRWMVVHFLGGVTGGFSNVFFGLSTRSVYLAGLGIMIVWEITEYAAGIRESEANRVLDIVVGLLGVVLALTLGRWLPASWERLAFVACAVGFGGGGFLGWEARQRRRRGN